jgi:hypothetical protein
MASIEKGRRPKAAKQNETSTRPADAPARKMTKPSAKAAPKAAVIDYPQENEQILPGHYAIRIAAAEEGLVEISIDGATWHVCRPASGYYWFDWEPTKVGSYKLAVRMRTADGKTVKSDNRSCTVVGSSSN